MTTRAERLAAQFAATNAEVIARVIACTDAQWRQPCASEGWSVAVVAHHIAIVHRDFIHLVGVFAAGQTLSPGSSMDEVDQINARHARDCAAVSRSETLDTLRTHGAALARLIRDMGDERLDNIAGVFGGRELSVAQVVEWIVIGHAAEHLESLRATLAA